MRGGSQGGGIRLAAAGLDPGVAACMPDVPLPCHYGRATGIFASNPYVEISRCWMPHQDKVERVFGTLAQYDGVNCAARPAYPFSAPAIIPRRK